MPTARMKDPAIPLPMEVSGECRAARPRPGGTATPPWNPACTFATGRTTGNGKRSGQGATSFLFLKEVSFLNFLFLKNVVRAPFCRSPLLGALQLLPPPKRLPKSISVGAGEGNRTLVCNFGN